LADQPALSVWEARRTRYAAPTHKLNEEIAMNKILSVVIAAMFAAVSFSALAADDKKGEVKSKDGKAVSTKDGKKVETKATKEEKKK
jgi:hypothetical protein